MYDSILTGDHLGSGTTKLTTQFYKTLGVVKPVFSQRCYRLQEHRGASEFRELDRCEIGCILRVLPCKRNKVRETSKRDPTELTTLVEILPVQILRI